VFPGEPEGFVDLIRNMKAFDGAEILVDTDAGHQAGRASRPNNAAGDLARGTRCRRTAGIWVSLDTT